MDFVSATAQITRLDPVALQLGPIAIHWYGLILGTAALLALMLSTREGKKHGIVPDTFMDMAFFAIPMGILGGRLYYVLFQWDYYREHPGDILAVWKGGLAIHGVIIAGVITILVFCKVKKLSFWKVVDILAPHVLLAQGIGRWGNFMNQEAHGGVVSREFLEGLFLPEFIINQMYIYNPSPGEGLLAGFYYHHPTFLYESIWNIIGFVILISLRKIRLRQGEMFFSYLIWYSVGRFFIEGMRTDSLMLSETLRMAQMISIALVIFAVLAIMIRRKTGASEKLYNDQ
ncbi:prolipoprotein diacylglyceryl transferase [Caldalkalibacillus mannanilyticus]|uniref:prolipoprotein diacylglyceryl transferase n=1 Tax=Caldalkalibacillus mannanilyticus TaxID=1418 RepID=UPI00046A14BB|nr:prolipoprotein diacylglyceryl transferase [Caldalkalibacillus mannanilyticus]